MEGGVEESRGHHIHVQHNLSARTIIPFIFLFCLNVSFNPRSADDDDDDDVCGCSYPSSKYIVILGNPVKSLCEFLGD